MALPAYAAARPVVVQGRVAVLNMRMVRQKGWEHPPCNSLSIHSVPKDDVQAFYPLQIVRDLTLPF